MNEQALTALKESIAAWEKKLQMAKDDKVIDIELGPMSCPLCLLFNSRLNKYFTTDASNAHCFGCPIKDAGHEFCNNTPYTHVEDLFDSILDDDFNEGDMERLEEYIQDEIDFLKGLLPKEGE